MRLIVVWFLLGCLAQALPLAPPQNKSEQGEAASQPTRTEAVSKPRDAPSTGHYSSQPGSPASQPKASQPDKPRRDWIDQTMAIATAFLSLFTLGMAFVIFFQLRATQHSERAWMIGSPEFNKFTRAPANNEVIVYPASYKNVGKSPARLLEAAVSLKMVEKLETLPRPPAYLPSEIVKFSNLLLVPEDSFALTAPPIQMTEEQFRRMATGKLFLVAHGFVKYRDIFGRKHETAFCHYYRIPDMVAPEVERFSRAITAPPEYSKAT